MQFKVQEFAAYPEMYCLVDAFLRMLDESGLRVALRMLVLFRLKLVQMNSLPFVDLGCDVDFNSVKKKKRAFKWETVCVATLAVSV